MSLTQLQSDLKLMHGKTKLYAAAVVTSLVEILRYMQALASMQASYSKAHAWAAYALMQNAAPKRPQSMHCSTCAHSV
jgi:hypothetical protein